MKPTSSTLLFFLFLHASLSSSHDITQILQAFPQHSSFNSLLSKYGVASQINTRSAITVLCPPNSVLDPLISSFGNNPSPYTIFNILSYHVLLDYYDPSRLRQLNGRATQATTLFQTTGLPAGNNGAVNISDIGVHARVGIPGQPTSQMANITMDLALFPYNISVLTINKALVPNDVTSQANVNITQMILQGGNHSTFVSLARATGVESILQGHVLPPGLTLFVPTNAAFDELPSGLLSKLSQAQKVAMVEYHALLSYYPMQSLPYLSSTLQRTLASSYGGSAYTVTVKTSHGSTLLISAVSSATVVDTLYSNNPVALFSISSVLLPSEMFVRAPSPAQPSSSSPARPPITAPSTPIGVPDLAPVIAPSGPYILPSTPAIAPSISPVIAPSTSPVIAPSTSPLPASPSLPPSLAPSSLLGPVASPLPSSPSSFISPSPGPATSFATMIDVIWPLIFMSVLLAAAIYI